MTTTTTSAVIAMTSSATLNAWINELCTAIFTTCGLTQTTDTGQCWSSGGGATATLSGSINTSCGYVIGRFNDTLQATAPVFLRIDFCTGAATTDAQLWVTVGTSSNGSGTIGGTVTAKVACGGGSTIASTSTNYTSYFCYNSTYGTLFVGFKYGAFSSDLFVGYFGFYLFRGSTATGAAAGDAVTLISQSITTTPGAGTSVQYLSYSKSAIYPATPIAESLCFAAIVGFTNAASIAGTPIIYPTMYANPTPGISNVCGLVNCSDVNVGTTFTSTILGSSSLTFLNAGAPCGTETLGGATQNGLGGASATCNSGSATSSWGLAVLWQ